VSEVGHMDEDTWQDQQASSSHWLLLATP
jgi:hypothetical protein